MEQLKTIALSELEGKRHTGIDDDPKIGDVLATQQFFDAHPDLNTETINQHASVQNANNAAIGIALQVVDDVAVTATKLANTAQATANIAAASASNAQASANAAWTIAQGAAAQATTSTISAQDAVGRSIAAQGDATIAKTQAAQAVAVASGIATTAGQALNISVEATKTAQGSQFVAEQAWTAAQAAAMVVNPVTGVITSVHEALQSIYNLTKTSPMTAQDFADNSITVDFMRSKNMTVTELATRGKQILIGG